MKTTSTTVVQRARVFASQCLAPVHRILLTPLFRIVRRARYQIGLRLTPLVRKFKLLPASSNIMLRYFVICEEFHRIEPLLHVACANDADGSMTKLLVKTKIGLGKYDEAFTLIHEHVIALDKSDLRACRGWLDEVVRMANRLRAPVAEFDELVYTVCGHPRERGTPESYEDWSDVIRLHNYLLNLSDERNARLVFESVDWLEAPSTVSSQVQRMASAHLTALEVVDLLREMWLRWPKQIETKLAYASSLIQANQPAMVLELFPDRKSSNPAVLNMMVSAYDAMGQRRNAIDLLVRSLRRSADQEPQWVRLLSFDASFDKRVSWALFTKCRKLIPPVRRNRVLMEFAIHRGVDVPDLRSFCESLLNDADPRTLGKVMQLAFVRSFYKLLRDAAQRQFEICPPSSDFKIEGLLAPCENYLYRAGDKKMMKRLVESVHPRCDSPAERMLIALGTGDVVSGLQARSESLAKAFRGKLKQAVRPPYNGSRRVLYPEKDLAGEIMQSFFFGAEFEEHGPFYVICDKRLAGIYRNQFPDIEFVPREPSRNLSRELEKFSDVPQSLCVYLDNRSLEVCRDAEFFGFDICRYFSESKLSSSRQDGWLYPTTAVADRWDAEFSAWENRPVVGFVSASRLTSPLRNVHWVELEYWQSIFAVPNVMFVNLDTNLDRVVVDQIRNQYGVDIHTPDVDLYNDFDSLIAILRRLDWAILPPNNLMEFASATGVNASIFSPTGIMRNWQMNGSGYVFSSNIQFIIPDDVNSDKKMMAEEAARHIRAISARKPPH